MTFDTLKFSKAIQRNTSMSADDADGIAEAFAETLTTNLVTRLDLNEAVTPLKLEIADVKSDLRLLKWMVSFNMAISVATLFLLIKH